MASKNNKQKMEMEFIKFLSQHPDIKKEFTINKTIAIFEFAMTICADYMLRYKELTPKEMDEFFTHCRFQLRCVGEDGWDTYFEEMNETLKTEYGVEVIGRLSKIEEDKTNG